MDKQEPQEASLEPLTLFRVAPDNARNLFYHLKLSGMREMTSV